MSAVLGADAVGSLGRVALVGCGHMGSAMLRRWLDAGLPADAVVVIDPARPVPAPGVRVVADVGEAGRVDTLVLAFKPQQLDEATRTQALGPLAPARAVSILAGATLASLAAALPDARWLRAMPNLPVATGRGVVALHGDGAGWGPGLADALMAPLGLVEWIADEALFDAVTALSGCGPGFVFRFVDALAAAGAALGLPADQATRLAIATVEGSATMAANSDALPAILADRVASPGGSTREGLNVLDRDDALRRLLADTLAASARRNRELGA